MQFCLIQVFSQQATPTVEFVTQTNIHVGWEANLKPLLGLNTASRPTQPGSLTTISGMLHSPTYSPTYNSTGAESRANMTPPMEINKAPPTNNEEMEIYELSIKHSE